MIAAKTIMPRPSQDICDASAGGIRVHTVTVMANRAPKASSQARVCEPKYAHDGEESVVVRLKNNDTAMMARADHTKVARRPKRLPRKIASPTSRAGQSM